MKRYLLRFHLGLGKNYFKWRLQDKITNEVQFIEDTANFVLYGCKLRNNKRTAQQIFDGSHKTVCSFVEFDSYLIEETNPTDTPILYNPRKFPYWNLNGEDVDNQLFDKLITFERRIYLP